MFCQLTNYEFGLCISVFVIFILVNKSHNMCTINVDKILVDNCGKFRNKILGHFCRKFQVFFVVICFFGHTLFRGLTYIVETIAVCEHKSILPIHFP